MYPTSCPTHLRSMHLIFCRSEISTKFAACGSYGDIIFTVLRFRRSRLGIRNFDNIEAIATITMGENQWENATIFSLANCEQCALCVFVQVHRTREKTPMFGVPFVLHVGSIFDCTVSIANREISLSHCTRSAAH